jgi:competence protein ComEC
VQYFGRVSLISFLANIAVVPAANIALALGLAMVIFSIFSTWLAGLVAAATHTLLYLTLHLITLAAHLRWSVLEVRITTGWHTLGYFLLLICVYSLWKGSWKRKTLIALIAVANLLAFYPDRGLTSIGSPSGMTVTFLDVGQGDATVIEYPDGKVLLIDAGARSAYSDAGRRVIVPFLKRKGITHLDAFVLTHDHNDHTGGARSVIESIPVEKIYFPRSTEPSPCFTELQDIIHEKNIPLEFLSAGKTIQTFDNSRLFVLHPCPMSATGAGFTRTNLNNTSVVLRLSYGRSSILLMGDAEEDVEQELCNSYGDFLHCSVVKVAHHGSINASSDRFISIVKPDFAVVSVGKNNKFNHPSTDVLIRYQQHHVPVERTDEQGAVVFRITPDSLWKVHWH